MAQISFTSKISVVNDYYAFHMAMEGQKPKYCNMDNSVQSKTAYTNGAAPCTAGGIADGSMCNLFHYLDPRLGDFEKLEQDSKDFDLKKAPSAFVTGGYSSSYISSRCLDRVIGFIKQIGVKPSVIWGQDGTATSVNYSSETDTWTMYNDTIKIKNLKDLKDTYSIVEISDNDELWIDGKKVK